jgi:energy-coupling factor transport system substrate-specific component
LQDKPVVRSSARRLFAVLLTITALVLNVGLSIATNALNLPFFMDSIGTAVVSATLGLWPGLVVAIGTEALFEVVYGMTMRFFPFAICGIATVLIVRAFVKHDRFGSVGEALLASLAVAMANAVLGGIVAAFVYGGITGAGIDFLVTGMVASGQTVLTASFWARVPANLFDKTVAVLVAYFARWPLMNLADRMSRPAVPRSLS